MDVSHAILFLENADFVRITGLYFPAKFEFFTRNYATRDTPERLLSAMKTFPVSA